MIPCPLFTSTTITTMESTTTLPLHLADLMLDLELYLGDYCAPGLPP
jgi:hypothetical protein